MSCSGGATDEVEEVDDLYYVGVHARDVWQGALGINQDHVQTVLAEPPDALEQHPSTKVVEAIHAGQVEHDPLGRVLAPGNRPDDGLGAAKRRSPCTS